MKFTIALALIPLCVCLSTFGPVFSSHSTTADESVIPLVEKFWAAFCAHDFKQAASMISPSGNYNTNSDGSFFKPLDPADPEVMKKSYGNMQRQVRVYYPEEIRLSETVIHCRFYLEGMFGDQPYRTRATQNWVKEGDYWFLKTAHYSSANYGGVHIPSSDEFSDQ